MKTFVLLLLLLLTASNVYAVEIESVKIGWGEEGYFRSGCFAPAEIRLKSDTDFNGHLLLKIDGLYFPKPLRLAGGVREDIKLPVLIITSRPAVEIEIINDKGDISGGAKDISLNLKEVSSDEFLIAVEQSALGIFTERFSRKYPDASRKTRLIPFTILDLPESFISYEALDMVVFSGTTRLSPRLQESLSNWSDKMGAVVLYRAEDIDTYQPLSQWQKGRPDNSCINPEIYNIAQNTIPDTVRKTYINFIIIYFIITLILAVAVWRVRWGSKTIVIFIIAICGSIFLLNVFFLPSKGVIADIIIHNPSLGKYEFISEESFWRNEPDLKNNNIFIRVMNYSKRDDITNAGLRETFLDRYVIKPVYKDVESFLSAPSITAKIREEIISSSRLGQPIREGFFRASPQGETSRPSGRGSRPLSGRGSPS
ncbi:MAG: hypothetical protein QME51_08725, partial [Planctomycetota bacterium]|nr:hypothetical protein [Planctomycetota bacterium]